MDQRHEVGYFSREDAAEYRTGLLALQAKHHRLIGLPAAIAGGGMRANGPGFLGVWLAHDPTDFGLVAIAPPPPPALAEDLRTGLTQALATDAEDDSYDLSWLETLPTELPHPH